ncbi:MAG TPA: right-handed parallel beta-helix repeat-containing protein [Candidatus Limnocylindrales bacterium]
MSIFISKRRLVGLVSASAVIGSMAIAAMPASTFAAFIHCAPTGFMRDGINLTAARMGVPVTGAVDATGCDIGVYNPTRVTNADIHGARYYGIVVNGEAVNTTNSKVHQIGEQPFDGTQHGRGILYVNGASGTISGNKVYDFQKNGIEVRGVTADASAPSTTRTSATIASNVITGRGHIGDIAQNGIVIMGNASTSMRNNTVSHIWYTKDDTYATGLLNVDVAAGRITVSANKFVDTQVGIDGPVTANAVGHSSRTIRPHGVRVDLFSNAKPAPQAVLGAKLDWKITVDGSTRLHIKQGFGEHAVYYESFRTHSGRHVVRLFENGHLVRRIIVRF